MEHLPASGLDMLLGFVRVVFAATAFGFGLVPWAGVAVLRPLNPALERLGVPRGRLPTKLVEALVGHWLLALLGVELVVEGQEHWDAAVASGKRLLGGF